MEFEVRFLGIFIFLAVVGIFAFISIAVCIDHDSWTPAPNNCYVHTHDYNTWGSHTHTTDMYCKVNK